MWKAVYMFVIVKFTYLLEQMKKLFTVSFVETNKNNGEMSVCGACVVFW